MCVDHLHWENSIAERAEKRRIESLTRFSNRKKYDSNGTEIEEHRHPSTNIQKIRPIFRVHRVGSVHLLLTRNLKYCLRHGPKVIIEGAFKVCTRCLNTAR